MSKAIRGAQLPGGVFTISATAKPLSADNHTPCKSIFIQAPTTNSTCYWGYDDLPDGVVRGYIQGGATLSLEHTISPSSVYIEGTAGNTLYWTSVPA